MKRLIDVSSVDAKAHFQKGSSYFNGDFPSYISFEPILQDVTEILGDKLYNGFAGKPEEFANVNYNFVANKDGRFAWRPYELIHPVIYISLVNLICKPENWAQITARLVAFEEGAVECCSQPVISEDKQTDTATQVSNWWQRIEQQSLIYSLEFSHVLHTDVTDCYGSIYTHSISWALHGFEEAKTKKNDRSLLGNKIDRHIQVSRHGQTNGISQGSVLMDFIAELILGYVDEQITVEIGEQTDFKILRYRDDYRIFANSDERAEEILKVISDKLRHVGMKLGMPKTYLSTNVVEGSIKPDKLAGIGLQNLGKSNAKTIQKQLLRLHAFSRQHPNSGSLRRLISELHTEILKQTKPPNDLEVQVAIATDIAFVSPLTFPAIAGILSHLISLASKHEKERLWGKVNKKMKRIPNNGHLEIWLQRVTKPAAVGIEFDSEEAICQIVNGRPVMLWESSWITANNLKDALTVSKILVSDASEAPEVITSEEIELFKKNAWAY